MQNSRFQVLLVQQFEGRIQAPNLDSASCISWSLSTGSLRNHMIRGINQVAAYPPSSKVSKLTSYHLVCKCSGRSGTSSRCIKFSLHLLVADFLSRKRVHIGRRKICTRMNAYQERDSLVKKTTGQWYLLLSRCQTRRAVTRRSKERDLYGLSKFNTLAGFDAVHHERVDSSTYTAFLLKAIAYSLPIFTPPSKTSSGETKHLPNHVNVHM